MLLVPEVQNQKPYVAIIKVIAKFCYSSSLSELGKQCICVVFTFHF